MDDWEQIAENYKICVVSASVSEETVKTSGISSRPDNSKITNIT